MKNKPRYWFAVSVVLLVLAESAGADIAREYYVSNDGSDYLPGTEAFPFRTINKACSVVSSGELPEGGVTIWIRNGIYRETVRPLRSGTARQPIRFVAYPGEEPIISGADVLDVAWTVYSGNIYKAPTSLQFEQLFVDGQLMNEARWPNTSIRTPVRVRLAICDEGTTDSTVVDSDLPPGNWNGAYVHIRPHPGWNFMTKQIRNYKPGRSFDFTDPTWFDFRRETRPGDPYWLFGALAGLDKATEWFKNQPDPLVYMVYLWCPCNPDPESHQIEVKRRDHAFNLSDCRYIHIEGLRIFAACINMENSSSCRVIDCHLKYPVHRRIEPQPDSWEYYYISPNYMSGDRNEWKDCAIAYCAGTGIQDEGLFNKVTNCIIHDVDYMALGGGAIGASGIRSEYMYNTVFESTSYLIPVGGRSLRVEHNEAYNCGWITHEHGPIHTGWTDGQGTVFAYNLVHDTRDSDGEGIVLEKESENFIVHHNLIWNIPKRGIKLNSPSLNNEIYNNTIMSSCEMAFWTCCGSYESLNQRGTKVINNIANAPMYFARGLGAPEQHHNGYYNVDKNGWPTANSGAINRGIVIPGITDGYVGSAPDIGCFEVGTEPWRAGADWTETDFTHGNRNFEGFETGDFVEFNWIEYLQSNNWIIVFGESSSGYWSARSSNISNGEVCDLRVTLECVDGDIVFNRKVSSESGSDYLLFYIDDLEKGKWSGEKDWEEISFPVTAGRRRFRWMYSKDYSGSEGQDAAWIDDIIFPIR